MVLQGLGSLQLPGCAQGGFQAFPGCTIGGPHTELRVKERKGKWEALRLAVRAPPRRATGIQTLFRTPKAVKAFVFSKDYDLLVTGGGDWAGPDLRAGGCGVPAQSRVQSCGALAASAGRDSLLSLLSMSSGPWLCCTASDVARHPRAQHSSSLLSRWHFFWSYKPQSKITSMKKYFAETQTLFSGSLPGAVLHP